MNRAMLQPNPLKDYAMEIGRKLLPILIQQSFEVLMLQEHRPALEKRLTAEELQQIHFLPEEEIYPACDFIIVVGGDGTILRIAGQASLYDKPVLGVNCGTIGFMSEIEPDELHLVEALKSGRYTLDKRRMLDIRVFDRNGAGRYQTVALNEAVVIKGSFNRVLRMAVGVDGQEVFRFGGDGVIVATPTGSTAYSLSAGGPILAPSSDCLSVTPICPHSLEIKSFVVSGSSIVTIMPEYNGHPIYLSPDGNTFELQEGDHVELQRSRRTFSLLRIKGQGFYEIIRKKLANERNGT